MPMYYGGQKVQRTKVGLHAELTLQPQGDATPPTGPCDPNTTDSVPSAGVGRPFCTAYPRPGKSPRRLDQTPLAPFPIQPAQSAMMSLLVLIHDPHVQLSRQCQSRLLNSVLLERPQRGSLTNCSAARYLVALSFILLLPFPIPSCPCHLPSKSVQT